MSLQINYLKKMNCNRKTKLVKKWSKQLYKVIVKDTALQEIIFERKDIEHEEATLVFIGLKEHFGIDGETIIRLRKTGMFSIGNGFSISLKKQNRKRLI